MTKVLITGATGNVGLALIHSLEQMDHSLELYAGVRNATEDKLKLAQYKVNCIPFDFTDFSTIDAALAS